MSAFTFMPEETNSHELASQFIWFGKNITRVSRVLLIIAITIATIEPPMWSLKAIHLFRLYYCEAIFSESLRFDLRDVTRVTC
jgi:hypothetical protein